MRNAFDPEVRERRARLLAVRLLRSYADHEQLPAFGLYTLLRHPVSTGLLERPGVHTSQTDWFVWTPKSWDSAHFPIERARSLLSSLSVVAPSEVWISCDTMRDADKWCCSLGVLALNVVSWIFHVSSPVRGASMRRSVCI